VITSGIDSSVQLSNNDLTTPGEIIEILQPFYEISIKCHDESAVRVSMFVPSIVHLIGHLRHIEAKIVSRVKLAQQLETSIHVRFAAITDRLYQIDPTQDSPCSDPLSFIVSL
jgi:hypothetical protein